MAYVTPGLQPNALLFGFQPSGISRSWKCVVVGMDTFVSNKLGYDILKWDGPERN